MPGSLSREVNNLHHMGVAVVVEVVVVAVSQVGS